MECNQDVANSLEQLLESLIKMVGKTNQSVDQLKQRVSQLEWMLTEQQEIERSRSQVFFHPGVRRTR